MEPTATATSVHFAYQTDVLVTTSGNRPLAGMSAEQARQAIQWGMDHATEMASHHADMMSPHEQVLAETDPKSWWQQTPLCVRLAEIAATVASPPAVAPQPGDPPAGNPSRSDSIRRELAQARQEAGVAERAAQEAASARDAQAARAADLEHTLAETRSELARLRLEADRAAASHAATLDEQAARHAADLDVHRSEIEAGMSSRLDQLTAVEQQLRDELDTTVAAEHEARQQLDDLAAQVERLTTVQQRSQSVAGLTKTVNIGTGIVMVAVAALVCAGSAATAHEIADWPWWQATLVPIVVEVGAVVELAALVRNRRLHRPSHWTAKVLAAGLLGLSLIGLGLHARSLSTHWWSMTLGLSLPLIMVGTARAALGHHNQPDR